jgi:hypothetical protein
MKIRVRKRFMVLATPALLLAGLGVSAVGVNASATRIAAPGKAAISGNVSHSFSTAEQQATTRYWARQGHASAKPVSLGVATAQPPRTENAIPSGTPMVVQPAKPGAAAASAAPVTRQLAASPDPALSSYAYPAPFTRFALFPNSQYSVYPNTAHGKLFFSQQTPSGDGNFVCSGTVVTSAGHWLVETAGHCVANSSTHTFSFNVEFVPAYRSGLAPFGVWTASRLWTKTAWINSGNLREDRGFVILNKNSSGKGIQDVTGSEGIAFNQGYLQHVVDFGYPAAAPFSGATEQLCLASFEEQDPFIEVPGHSRGASAVTRRAGRAAAAG